MTRVPIIIDRIEDGFATLAMPVPVGLLPENAREGDVLFCDEDGLLQIDIEETRKRRKTSYELFEELLDKN